MVISTPRDGAEARLVAALRATFDASVMNFGSYNLLYAENLLGQQTEEREGGGIADPAAPAEELPVQEQVSAARHLLVGYRREPLEIVLCPVDLAEALPRAGRGQEDAAVDAEPSVPLPVNLTNLAGMAVEGSTVELALSTGRRVRLEVLPVVRFERFAATQLDQRLDAEDFYAFVDHFMDTVETMGR